MSFYYARKIIPLQYTFLLYGIGCRGYGLGKKRRDLVQRRWRNKGWSRFVHQVRARGFGKSEGTWCKGDGRTRAGGDSCTKSKRPDLEKGGGTWCKGDGGTRGGADSCTKSPFVANERSQRKRSVPAIPFHILRIIPENAILLRNFVKIRGNDAK